MISREDLIEAYANSIIDGMDINSMEKFIYDVITERLDSLTNMSIAMEVFEYDETLFGIDSNTPLIKGEIVRKFVQKNSDSYPIEPESFYV